LLLRTQLILSRTSWQSSLRGPSTRMLASRIAQLTQALVPSKLTLFWEKSLKRVLYFQQHQEDRKHLRSCYRRVQAPACRVMPWLCPRCVLLLGQARSQLVH
jgi:hypothetical protein